MNTYMILNGTTLMFMQFLNIAIAKKYAVNTLGHTLGLEVREVTDIIDNNLHDLIVSTARTPEHKRRTIELYGRLDEDSTPDAMDNLYNFFINAFWDDDPKMYAINIYKHVQSVKEFNK